MTIKRRIGVLVPLVLALLAWTLAFAGPASARTEPPAEEESPADGGLPDQDLGGQVTREGPQVQVTEADGVRFYGASKLVTSQPEEGSPLMDIVSSHPEFKVRYDNVIQANSGAAKWVRHYYAITHRLTGSGPYEAEAHAVLIEGDSYEDEQVFSGFTHSCAAVVKVNGRAITCISPKFSTSPGDKWFAISGHYYDHGNDGEIDDSIAGELDFVWTAPSS